MARKGGFLKGIVASAATYAVKTAVDIAANPENMQKVAQLVSEQQVGSKLKQAAASMHLPAALSPSARVAKQLDAIEETLEAIRRPISRKRTSRTMEEYPAKPSSYGHHEQIHNRQRA